jgi:hypothetical protein
MEVMVVGFEVARHDRTAWVSVKLHSHVAALTALTMQASSRALILISSL